MSTYAARTFSMAFDDARAVGLLNDTAKDVYTDAVLLPHGAKAFSRIQAKFAEHSLPLAETVTELLTYAVDAETIVVPVGVTDLEAPLEIWQKETTNEIWTPMKQVANLRAPLEEPSDGLSAWEWRNGTIAVLASESARDIFARYRRRIAYPAAGTVMGFDGIYDAVVSGTAFYAATSRPDVQAVARALFYEEIESAVTIASRDRQGITYRQQGWSGGGGRRPIKIETA